jgi:hypothetical protein
LGRWQDRPAHAFRQTPQCSDCLQEHAENANEEFPVPKNETPQRKQREDSPVADRVGLHLPIYSGGLSGDAEDCRCVGSEDGNEQQVVEPALRTRASVLKREAKAVALRVAKGLLDLKPPSVAGYHPRRISVRQRGCEQPGLFGPLTGRLERV